MPDEDITQLYEETYNKVLESINISRAQTAAIIEKVGIKNIHLLVRHYSREREQYGVPRDPQGWFSKHIARMHVSS